MAKTTSTELQLGFVYSPLTVSSSIEVIGNVPEVQQFDISTGLYTPDYTTTFLCLKCRIDVTDPDGVLTDADKVLTNLAWYKTEDGVDTQIVANSNSGYAISLDGTTLTVMKNVTPDTPPTYRCEAQFYDPRTGVTYPIVATKQVMAESVSQRPVLRLETPLAIRYDPIRDTTPIRKVKASLKIGDTEVPAAQREFVWQKKDENDSAFADIDGLDIMDYDVSLNADGDELTIDCSLIGTKIDIRCYAKYNPFGNPSSVAIDTTTPMEMFSVIRYQPTLQGKILAPEKFLPTQKQIFPELVVSDSKGVIATPDTKIDISWYTSKGVAAGTVTKGSVVASGSKPTISTANVVKTYGGKLIAEMKLKGPMAALTTSDGKVLVGGSGEVLLGRKQ